MDKSNVKLQALAAGLFSTDMSGSPLFLILAILCIGYGIWKFLQDRKKPKAQRDQEQKRLSQKFIDNLNRNESILHSDSPSDEPISGSAGAQKSKKKK